MPSADSPSSCSGSVSQRALLVSCYDVNFALRSRLAARQQSSPSHLAGCALQVRGQRADDGRAGSAGGGRARRRRLPAPPRGLRHPHQPHPVAAPAARARRPPVPQTEPRARRRVCQRCSTSTCCLLSCSQWFVPVHKANILQFKEEEKQGQRRTRSRFYLNRFSFSQETSVFCKIFREKWWFV